MSKNGSLCVVGVIIAFGWLLIAVVQPGGPGMPSWLENLAAGLVLSTIFGQVSLAAAWCALGPYALIRRLPLSFTWLAAIVTSFGFAIGRSPHPNGFGVLLVYGGAVVVQWLLVQSPIWLFVVRYRLRVAHRDDVVSITHRHDQQFGIRQVLILTTLVALVLGAGRFLLGGSKQTDHLTARRMR
jgi:hypothetical protein